MERAPEVPQSIPSDSTPDAGVVDGGCIASAARLLTTAPLRVGNMAVYWDADWRLLRGTYAPEEDCVVPKAKFIGSLHGCVETQGTASINLFRVDDKGSAFTDSLRASQLRDRFPLGLGGQA